MSGLAKGKFSEAVYIPLRAFFLSCVRSCRIPRLEYWYFLHKNPTSTKYFGTYEELLKDLKTFTIDKRLFSCYDKKENEDYRAGEGLYKKLLPYLKKMKFSKLKAFDIEECDCESVSEMYKLFNVLQIQP